MGDSVCGGSSKFPLAYFDGNTEIELGNIVVSSATNFKNLQSLVSGMIGISPHQITIYLEKNSPSPSPPHSFPDNHRRKIPVTSKTDFGSILGDPNCYFRAVLKKSRRTRRRRPPNQSGDIEGEGYNGHSINRRILQPDKNLSLQWFPFWGHMDYGNWTRMLQREQARYKVSLNLNSDLYSHLSLDHDHYWRERMMRRRSEDGSTGGSRETEAAICEFCEAREEEEEDEMERDKTAPFHLCKKDPVIVGFRSTAGPVARPAKR